MTKPTGTETRGLLLNCANCEFHNLHRSGFDTLIAQSCVNAFSVLRSSRTEMSEYQDHEHKFNKWLNTIFGLHHLQADEVEDAFVDVIMSICPDHNKCTARAIFYRTTFCVL